MKLIIATPSPFARKIRVALREKNISCEEVTENPWNASSTLQDLNPLGQIPILVSDKEEVIYDSRVIFEYLEQLGEQHHLLPSDPSDRIRARKTEAIADGICNAVVLIVLEYHRPKNLQSKDWIDRQQQKIRNGLIALNEELDKNDWAVRENMTIGDIAVACTLSYIDLRLPNFQWRENHSNLANFSMQMEKRDSFRDTRLRSQTINPIN